MKQILATVALGLAVLFVLTGICTAGPSRLGTEPSTVDRLLPHAALLGYPDGAFAVVPRSVLPADVAAGDLLDLQLRPLTNERLALAAEPNRVREPASW